MGARADHEINNEILRQLGGAVWHPPAFPDGWELRSDLEDLRQTARKLVEREFGGVGLWGWKDPATCLTLPFWQTLLPPMHYVISVRSPLDVATSQAPLRACSLERALYLWALYLKSAFRKTASFPRMCISFERLMCNSTMEIRRLAAFIGKSTLQASDIEMVSRECIDRELWHHRSSDTGLLVAQEAYQALAARKSSVEDTLHALERAVDVLERAVEEEEARRLQQERDRWFHEEQMAKAELGQLVSNGESAILIDSNSWSDDDLPAGQLVRFLERDGFSMGPPEDDVAAIEEIERLQRRGVGLVVIAWPAFWWLDWFRELQRYLRSSYPCIMQNERLIVFDMRCCVVPYPQHHPSRLAPATTVSTAVSVDPRGGQCYVSKNPKSSQAGFGRAHGGVGCPFADNSNSPPTTADGGNQGGGNQGGGPGGNGNPGQSGPGNS